jgi:hypothetical protein
MSIRLLDSTRQNVIDSIDLEYEDSFCLETFGDLAQSFHEFESEDCKRLKGECGFIIARCQTWDHKQPGKRFYSYYNAFLLNKILFQTQVYLGRKLIHRLHVLNPLTNTDIIGNVQYFRVEKKGTLAGMDDISEEIGDQDIELAPLSPGLGSKQASPLRIDTRKSKRAQGLPSAAHGLLSATVREIETGVSQKWTFASASVAVDKDEDEEPGSAKSRKRLSFSKSATRASTGNRENETLYEEISIPFTPLTAPPDMIPPPIAIHIGIFSLINFRKL